MTAPRVPGTVGPPLAGVSVRIVDPETGRHLPANEIGMIEVRGPNVFQGYWRMPEKTAAEFRPDGFFITGDLGMVDDAGYVHIVGRGKDLIITGGFNVYPKEVEAEIDAVPGVVESAVVGLPHADFGEGVTAIVVPRTGRQGGRGCSACRARRAACPLQAAEARPLRRELPRNAMGKVQKAALRQRYAGLYAAEGGAASGEA